MSELLHLSPLVLEWAANQVGDSLGDVARKISKRSPEKVIEGRLSHPQAVKFAHIAGIPFGYLFLDTPPENRKPPIADFRTIQISGPLSKNFFDTYDDIDFKQSWYRDFLFDSGAEPLPFIGRFSASTDANTIAANMRSVLGLSISDYAALKSSDELFSLISAKSEAAGILVFKNSIVGGNATRPLSVAEFRGFVLSDKLAPVIFINGADAPAAWVFTLAHELAHLWLGDSGISDAATSSQNSHERLCNAVAAEFLVPHTDFLAEWNRIDGKEYEKLENARKRFRVSTLVISRRAFDLGLISEAKYQSVYAEVRSHAAKPKEPGGDYYRTLAVRNSKNFTSRVARLAATGTISFREAGQLLNTNPNNVMTYYAKQRALLT